MKEAMIEIEKKRCQVDPIYCILTNPSYVQPGDNVPFIDGLVELSVEYLKLRYGNKLLCSKNVARIHTLLVQTDDSILMRDNTIKVFFLMHVFKWETELSAQIRALYKLDDPACIYSHNHYHTLMRHVGENIDKTFVSHIHVESTSMAAAAPVCNTELK